MARRHLTGKNGRIEFTLEGLTFFRSKSWAGSRGVGRVRQVDWASIAEAALTESRKGKSVVRIVVQDAAAVSDSRDDPHALKVKRSDLDHAREFVARVNDEIATRRRWRGSANGKNAS